MQAQDELYQLIKSLSASEKRYFKVHAGRHVQGNKNNYEKLFDIIADWPEDKPYDEEELKEVLRKKRLGKFLSSEKVKLMALIAEAMRAYRSGDSVEQSLTDLLADESFFKNKRLNRLRLKTIQKAKEIAKQYELFPFLLTVLQREAVAAIEWQQEKLGSTQAAIEAETKEAFELLHRSVDLRRAYDRIFTTARASLGQSDTAMQLAVDTIESALLTNYQCGTSFICDKLYYQINALCHRLLFQMDKYAEFQQKVVDLYDTYPHFIEYDRTAYKVALYNLMNALMKNTDHEKFNKYLEKAQSLSSSDPDEKGEDWQNVVHLKLMYALNTENAKAGAELQVEIDRGLEQYKNKVNTARKMVLWHNLTTCLLLTGDFNKALDYNNKILSDKSESRQDIKEECRLLEIIIHYELKNFQVVENAMRNAERHLKNRHDLNEQEVFFFKSFRQLLKYSGQRLPDELVQEILNRWEEISGTNNVGAVDFFISWLAPNKVITVR